MFHLVYVMWFNISTKMAALITATHIALCDAHTHQPPSTVLLPHPSVWMVVEALAPPGILQKQKEMHQITS